MNDRRVPSSRLARLTRLGWLGTKAIPVALERLREGLDAPAGERGPRLAKALKRHADIADKALSTLGDMKGIALKAGQMLSYMDGAIPAEYAPIYKGVLERLQARAPAMRWEAIAPVLRDELGDPTALFSHIDETPLAAASIGQVHRATLRTGEAVVLKIQYPGIDRAMSADLKNAGMLQTLLAPMLAMMGAKGQTRAYLREIQAEIQERLLEELDYTREAASQTRFRALLAENPDLLVPRVFPEASTCRVLCSEYVEGRTLQAICDPETGASQAERDRYGTILTRTLLHCLHTHGLFHADPHPGNYLFPADGRVCLLDFGCVKELAPKTRDDINANLRAALKATRVGTPEARAELAATLSLSLRLDATPDPDLIAIYQEFYLYLLRPALTEGPFDFTEAYTRESFDRVIEAARAKVFAGRRIPKIPDLPPVPADYTFLNRLQWGFFSILAMLRARVNWQAQLPAELLA